MSAGGVGRVKLSAAALEGRQPIFQFPTGVAVEPEVNEPGFAEQPPVGRTTPPLEAFIVALGLVRGREQLQERHASKQAREGTQAAPNFCERHVMEDVRANDEIEGSFEPQSPEVSEAA